MGDFMEQRDLLVKQIFPEVACRAYIVFAAEIHVKVLI